MSQRRGKVKVSSPSKTTEETSGVSRFKDYSQVPELKMSYNEDDDDEWPQWSLFRSKPVGRKPIASDDFQFDASSVSYGFRTSSGNVQPLRSKTTQGSRGHHIPKLVEDLDRSLGFSLRTASEVNMQAVNNHSRVWNTAFSEFRHDDSLSLSRFEPDCLPLSSGGSAGNGKSQFEMTQDYRLSYSSDVWKKLSKQNVTNHNRESNTVKSHVTKRKVKESQPQVLQHCAMPAQRSMFVQEVMTTAQTQHPKMPVSFPSTQAVSNVKSRVDTPLPKSKKQSSLYPSFFLPSQDVVVNPRKFKLLSNRDPNDEPRTLSPSFEDVEPKQSSTPLSGEKDYIPESDAVAQIEDILSILEEVNDKIQSFSGTCKDRRYVDLEKRMYDCIMKLDDINIDDRDDIRQLRKNASRKVRSALAVLKNKAAR